MTHPDSHTGAEALPDRATHEFALIEQARLLAARQTSSALQLGIGDDAAVWRPSPGYELLLAKDVLMEGTHFLFPPATPELAGRKALAVNLSDIAAMGGTPRAALVGLALPRSRGADFARRVQAGVQQLADASGVLVVGGDTNIWDGPLVVSVTVLGEVAASSAWQRSGAQPGDVLCVTGPLGGSYPSGRHLRLSPRLDLVPLLRERVTIRAAIDLSDGLLRDVGHLLQGTAAGARLDASAIPIHPDVPASAPWLARLEQALTDGEDFELLLAVAPDDWQELRHDPILGQQVVSIGEISATAGLVVLDPQGAPLSFQRTGYQHQFGE